MKIDLEEAKFQAEKRREAIERAKTLLYYQTDRVKQFHVSRLVHENFSSTTSVPFPNVTYERGNHPGPIACP